MVKIDDFVWIMGEVFIVCRKGGALIDIETKEIAEQFNVKVDDIPIELCDVLLESRLLDEKNDEEMENMMYELMGRKELY
jgi:hypothetical protein